MTMQRRNLFFLAALAPVAMVATRYLSKRGSRVPSPIDYRQRALRLNELAANIATPADALRVVDLIADLFADSLPSALGRSAFRKRVAQAEFAAVSDPRKLVPEARMAAAWNAFAATIHAPRDFQRTEAEVHYQRDALWVTARMLWSTDHGNIWTVPTIYATRSDGSLAPGCRPLEAFRILWDFANMSDNLVQTRESVAKGELFSNSFPKPQAGTPVAAGERRIMVSGAVTQDPMRETQRQFMNDHGRRAFNAAVVTMLDSTLG